MRFFCSACWNEIAPDTKVCPFCGADIEALDASSFDEKVIRAFHHPDPQTVRRAVFISGEKQIPQALQPLVELLANSHDPYLQEEIIKALCHYNDPSLIGLLQTYSRAPYSFIVRKIADECINKLLNKKPPTEK